MALSTFVPTYSSAGRSNAFIPGVSNTAQQAAPASSLFAASTPASTVSGSSSSLSSLVSQLSSPTVASPAAQWQEDPRLSAMVADLMQRAQQTDEQIASQANNAYEAQRLVADRDIARQQTRSLATNGVLPTGGLAAQYKTELQTPVYDRLNAQRAQTELDLRNQRDGVKQGVTGTLASLDNNKNQFTLSQLAAQQQAEAQRQQLLAQAQYQQASLSQQAQLASQQLAAEQARAQQAASLSQQQLDYQKQRDAQSLDFQRQQAELANQRFYAGGGGGGSSAGGGAGGSGGGSFGFDLGADDTAQMRQNYQSSVEAERLRSGRNADGSYRPPTSTSQYPTTSRTSSPTVNPGNSTPGAGATVSTSFYNPTASFYNAPTMNGGSGFTNPASMFSWA